ncbi:mas-related G-protein coupled receptor member X1-like [Nannospalax galili]|uniref:mas-related G-protein coupled receptor member X1-like n=1 Tax=Nannospalax galili TaxID=1026970 RepID=UPI0004ED0498|nr:mas-related G-protein coupled receptor member X1-like [Nannospalax galili]
MGNATSKSEDPVLMALRHMLRSRGLKQSDSLSKKVCVFPMISALKSYFQPYLTPRHTAGEDQWVTFDEERAQRSKVKLKHMLWRDLERGSDESGGEKGGTLGSRDEDEGEEPSTPMGLVQAFPININPGPQHPAACMLTGTTEAFATGTQQQHFHHRIWDRTTSVSLLSKDPTTPTLTADVNSTSEDSYDFFATCPVVMILFWLVLIVAAVGVTGNAVVLWLLGFRMRRNAISVYVLNLAAADFMVLCNYIIVLLVEKISPNFFNLFFVTVSTIMTFCSYFTGLSVLSGISIERFLSTLYPIWYRCHRPRHTSAIICGLIWTVSLLVSTLSVSNCLALYFGVVYYNWCEPLGFSLAVYLIFLCVILSGSNLILTVRMFCGSRRIPLTKLYVTVLLTVLVFLFCGLPFGINFFLVARISRGLFHLPCYYALLCFFLSCVNSSANPIIYFFSGSFRQHKYQNLKIVLQRAFQDTPGEDGHGGSLPQESLEVPSSRLEQE